MRAGYDAVTTVDSGLPRVEGLVLLALDSQARAIQAHHGQCGDKVQAECSTGQPLVPPHFGTLVSELGMK